MTFCILSVFDRDQTRLHPLISFWAKSILAVCPLMRVHFEGREHLKPGTTYVLVANHQSIADIIAVLHLRLPFKFIAKSDLFWIPFFGWALSLAGYIPLTRGDQKSGRETIQKAMGYLKRGVSVLLFPEGTRSRNGEIHAFKVGAFKLATELGLPVVPLVIQGTRDLIPKGTLLINHRIEVTVRIGTPHPPPSNDSASIEAFCQKVRSEMIFSLNEMRSQEEVVLQTKRAEIALT
ncbi:MAG: hypothetical protein A3C35_04945 [Omnitrophica bacterium RIFCSPHIGHO2_02_FULL_46_11]|nr:MAG: hypothetical protein A3C35_04945 [Omnitrophica bacterium RIFCSPHIGHO2_02_FULL_46_11]OGW87831.1 MAG: hypothetical protein A3A81_01635 [Omnitrophica bacterium RIFCSPLOWO2_01_FULL_45_10b]